MAYATYPHQLVTEPRKSEIKDFEIELREFLKKQPDEQWTGSLTSKVSYNGEDVNVSIFIQATGYHAGQIQVKDTLGNYFTSPSDFRSRYTLKEESRTYDLLFDSAGTNLSSQLNLSKVARKLNSKDAYWAANTRRKSSGDNRNLSNDDIAEIMRKVQDAGCQTDEEAIEFSLELQIHALNQATG